MENTKQKIDIHDIMNDYLSHVELAWMKSIKIPGFYTVRLHPDGSVTADYNAISTAAGVNELILYQENLRDGDENDVEDGDWIGDDAYDKLGGRNHYLEMAERIERWLKDVQEVV